MVVSRTKTITFRRVPLRKLTAAEVVKKYTAFSGTRRFHRLLTRSWHFSLFSNRSHTRTRTRTYTHNLISLIYFLILFSSYSPKVTWVTPLFLVFPTKPFIEFRSFTRLPLSRPPQPPRLHIRICLVRSRYENPQWAIFFVVFNPPLFLFLWLKYTPAPHAHTGIRNVQKNFGPKTLKEEIRLQIQE